MGIGWVQINEYNQIVHRFSAQIRLWPSSYKAELFSILSAISTVPRNSFINIYTDSQSVISKFYTLTNQLQNSNKLFKFCTWPLWHIFLNIIKSFNLQITFHKVQAHTDNPFNNLADSLAKQHILLQPLIFNYTNIYNPYHILQWEQNFIELPTRYFIKSVCNAYIMSMWSSQKRNNEWTHLNYQIDWTSTWLYLNHNQKPTSTYTSFKLNQLIAFKTKYLLNELPTQVFLHNRYPSIFTDTNCFKCNLPNSPTHWCSCSNTFNTLSNIIYTSVNQILLKTDLDLSPSQLQELVSKICHHPCFDRILFQSNLHFIDITLKGLIPKSLIEVIRNFNISSQSASQLVIKTLLHINEQIYERIWKPYCIEFSNWKNITKFHPDIKIMLIILSHNLDNLEPLNNIAKPIHTHAFVASQINFTYNIIHVHQLVKQSENLTSGQSSGLNIIFPQTIF